ncbi:hypothetical protein C8R44DRAFT_899458, partial [Mycena epipterygia]
MPVSFSVAKHCANSYPELISHTAQEILEGACRDYARRSKEILQFSFPRANDGEVRGRDFAAKIPNVLPTRNGFVNTVLSAYNGHYALMIRPDDVWLAILSQFNFFVNANAELLRANFVAHEGKRELIIHAEGTRFDINFEDMALQMTYLIEKNVVDPALRQWATPDFTTTTGYFSYTFDCFTCGIPRVTLEGERSDWVNILGRLEKLKEYGIQTIAWYHLLRPVISRFILAFDAPASQENIDFWQKVAHRTSADCGPDYYSGWINAFNVFSEDGAWLGHRLKTPTLSQISPETLTAEEFWSAYSFTSRRWLIMDGTPYHPLDTNRVPLGYAGVDVILIDAGERFDTFMVAGMVGKQVSSSDDPSLSSTGKDDTLQPVAGWWICTKKENVMSEREEQAWLDSLDLMFPSPARQDRQDRQELLPRREPPHRRVRRELRTGPLFHIFRHVVRHLPIYLYIFTMFLVYSPYTSRFIPTWSLHYYFRI